MDTTRNLSNVDNKALSPICHTDTEMGVEELRTANKNKQPWVVTCLPSGGLVLLGPQTGPVEKRKVHKTRTRPPPVVVEESMFRQEKLRNLKGP